MRTGSIAATAALLLGCVAAPAERAMLDEVRPVGAPVDCIETPRILTTHVRNAQTIDFELRGGGTWRNVLPTACTGLGFNRGFSYRSDVSRLCSIDTITVLQPGGGVPGPTCGLGAFQRVERLRR